LAGIHGLDLLSLGDGSLVRAQSLLGQLVRTLLGVTTSCLQVIWRSAYGSSFLRHKKEISGEEVEVGREDKESLW
jgi:hypothetical protein